MGQLKATQATEKLTYFRGLQNPKVYTKKVKAHTFMTQRRDSTFQVKTY